MSFRTTFKIWVDYCAFVTQSKRNESKLVKLLANTNLNANQRQKSGKEILKDIYRNHDEGFYELGLAEDTGKSNFGIKLFFFKKTREPICPAFHFFARVNQSAREGTNIKDLSF